MITLEQLAVLAVLISMSGQGHLVPREKTPNTNQGVSGLTNLVGRVLHSPSPQYLAAEKRFNSITGAPGSMQGAAAEEKWA